MTDTTRTLITGSLISLILIMFQFPHREILESIPILQNTAFGEHEEAAFFLGRLLDSDSPMTVSTPTTLLSDVLLLQQFHFAANKLKESCSRPRTLALDKLSKSKI